MLTTREFTRLYSEDGENRDIKPNIEFEPFEGNYTVGSYARIRDTETDEIITLLPGQKITGVGKVVTKEVIKPKPKRRKKVDDEI